MNSKSYELTDKDVKKLSGNSTKLVEYTDLYKYNSLEDLFSKYKKIILLYIHTSTGTSVSGHWSGLIRHSSKRCEHWDSYGLKPDEILYKYKSKVERAQTNQESNYLTKLLYDASTRGWTIEFNEYPYQSKNQSVTTCGRYVGLRLLFHDIPLNDYQEVFNDLKKNGINQDDLIVDVTNYLLLE